MYFVVAILDACWRFKQMVRKLRAFIDTDITNRVRSRLKVNSGHRAHPRGSSDLENLFAGHLKTLLE